MKRRATQILANLSGPAHFSARAALVLLLALRLAGPQTTDSPSRLLEARGGCETSEEKPIEADGEASESMPAHAAAHRPRVAESHHESPSRASLLCPVSPVAMPAPCSATAMLGSFGLPNPFPLRV